MEREYLDVPSRKFLLKRGEIKETKQLMKNLELIEEFRRIFTCFSYEWDWMQLSIDGKVKEREQVYKYKLKMAYLSDSRLEALSENIFSCHYLGEGTTDIQWVRPGNLLNI